MGNVLLKGHVGDIAKGLGKRWVDLMLGRQQRLIVSKWTSPLKAIRALSVTKKSTNHWFLSVVKPLIVDAGIEPHNIYGMDETGFPLGDSGC